MRIKFFLMGIKKKTMRIILSFDRHHFPIRCATF